MKITSVLFASAAALVAVSGAQAADAIVAAEPEAVEYVRVCDAFGTGFFYIPGSETCLKISGYVRTQYDFGRNVSAPAGSDAADWDTFTRAQLTFDARTETDLGALRSVITLRGNADQDSSKNVFVEEAYIQLGGFTAGKVYSYWDNDLSGEADSLASNSLFNSVRYDVNTGAFEVGVSIDELEGISTTADNNIGIAGNLGLTAGAVSANLIGGYDVEAEEGALRLIATADVGPGTLGFAAVWASGVNAYYDKSEWAVAAEYGVKATDKLKITLGAQYSDSLKDGSTFGTVDQWAYAATFDYAITSGLAAKVNVEYTDPSNASGEWGGFVRLQRSF